MAKQILGASIAKPEWDKVAYSVGFALASAGLAGFIAYKAGHPAPLWIGTLFFTTYCTQRLLGHCQINPFGGWRQFLIFIAGTALCVAVSGLVEVFSQ